VEKLRRRFPLIKAPASEDICYATQNRQSAVLELASTADAILVVGSKNSSNSCRLVDVARGAGVPAYLIDDIVDINLSWLKDVNSSV
jgi:4-hydroxy-3-methylbut-2-enyl diphosphate reductase